MSRKVLIIDNYDSFTYNLFQMVGEIEPNVTVFRNDALTIDEITKFAPTHIILSPGPGYPKNAGICEDLVKQFHGKVPILGVCLGHQAICEAFGGTILPAKEKVHGKATDISIGQADGFFAGLPQRIRIARYHSLAVSPETLPNQVKVTAIADDGEIMAVEVAGDHSTTYGVQFHPESILTDDGAQMLRNFLK